MALIRDNVKSPGPSWDNSTSRVGGRALGEAVGPGTVCRGGLTESLGNLRPADVQVQL